MNPDNTPTPTGYAQAAQHYWTAGWRGILPIPQRRKKPVPEGWTGYNHAYPSYADIYAWIEEKPGHGLCLRMPDDVVGIDVDAYGDKTGGKTLTHAEQLWGTLPPTTFTTSRDDHISGIRLYRVPPGLNFQTIITFPEHGLGNIEVIQRTHRYAIAWPSLHRDTGRPYQWFDHTGKPCGIPQPDQLPPLPDTWITALTTTTPTITTHANVIAVVAALNDGDPDHAVTDRLTHAHADLQGPAGSRFDATRNHVLALLRLDEQGHPGIRAALTDLRNHYINAVTDRTNPDEAAAEYTRMITNKRGLDLIASTPTPDHQADNHALEKLAGPQNGTQPPQTGVVTQEDIEWFWTLTGEYEYLGRIRQFAHARRCSSWSVLAAVLLRVATTIPPHVTLPPLCGGHGSLNLFACLVGPPGVGKGAAVACARDAYPGPDGIDRIHIGSAGSAEGIAHQYMHREGRDIVRDRNAVMFVIPEIDTFIGLGDRTGSVLWPTLREAFMGEDIGFTWADATKRLPMEEHSYRLTMLLGVQPDHAMPLLADASGGFPQRCLWFPATDPTIPRERPDTPPPIGSLNPADWAGSRTDKVITLPDHVIDEIDADHLARNSRPLEDGPLDVDLDAHAMFTREKVAAIIAILAGRNHVTTLDWELSQIIMHVSDTTRTTVEKICTSAAIKENDAKGYAAGQRQLKSEEVVEKAKAKRVGMRLLAILRQHGPMPRRELRTIRLAQRDRPLFDDAIETQIDAGTIEYDGEKYRAAGDE